LDGGDSTSEIGSDNRQSILQINGVADGNFAGTIIDGAGTSPQISLVKTGSGTQTLSGANTYTGTTTVNGGTLKVNGSIAGGSVYVAPGGTLGGTGTIGGSVTSDGTIAPGDIGTLTFATAPVLNSDGTVLMEVNLTNAQTADLLVASSGTFEFGGALQVVNTGPTLTNGSNFTLFSGATDPTTQFSSIVGSPGVGLAYSFNPTNGVLSVVPGVLVNPNPTNITATVSSGNLNLSWPIDHTGWRLLVQTNNLANGISGNINDWMTVAGSTVTNQMTIPIISTTRNEFYRLVYP
jgi:autotransporter-associated beta strand protein